MATVVIGHAPNREMYEAVNQAMMDANGGAMPTMDGLIVHTASELTDGRIQIVDVWATAEAEQYFVDKVLMPAFAKAGVPQEAMADSSPERTETFELTT